MNSNGLLSFLGQVLLRVASKQEERCSLKLFTTKMINVEAPQANIYVTQQALEDTPKFEEHLESTAVEHPLLSSEHFDLTPSVREYLPLA